MTVVPLPGLRLDLAAIVDLARTADVIAVDTEGYSLLGLSFAFKSPMGNFAGYIPWKHLDDDNDQELCQRFWEIAKTKRLVFHNGPHDLLKLEEEGFLYDGYWYDTMLMEHWLNENLPSYSLDMCSRRHGGQPKNRPQIMQFIIDTQGWEYVPLELMTEYASHDALITLELFYDLIEQFQAEDFDTPELWGTEQVFALIIARMIKRGIRIDSYFCMRKIIKGEEEMGKCRKLLGINPGSRVGLEHLLLEQLGLPVIEQTPKGKPSFNAKVMEQYDLILENRKDPVAKTILRYRGFQKTTSANYRAYINLADEHGVLHPGFKLHATVTTRLACEKPALHQIPRESEKPWNGDLKQAFIAREGFGLWEFDYAQLEFRLSGAYSEEPLLIEIFNQEGRNLFKEMAAELGWEYDPTKRFNYSTLYGGGAANTSRIFNVSMTQAKAMINKYYRKYPHLKEAQNSIANLARRRKFVRYWTGRRRHYVTPHKAFNSVIQGGAAEIVKRAMINLDQQVCDDNCYMLLQIHDAVVFEIRTDMETDYIPRIQKIMETPPRDFGVLFPVEVKPFGGRPTSEQK